MHWIDPADLPEHRGALERFLINPHGDIDGLVLEGSRQVHVPPHLTSQLVSVLAIGEEVSVRGVRLRGTPIIAAVAVAGRRGEPVVDEGPDAAEPPSERHARAPRRRRMRVEGKVRMGLYGAKGELRGALLTSGAAIRVPPPEAERLHHHLEVGAEVEAMGEGVENEHGICVEADSLRLAGGRLQAVEPKHHKPKPHHGKH